MRKGTTTQDPRRHRAVGSRTRAGGWRPASGVPRPAEQSSKRSLQASSHSPKAGRHACSRRASSSPRLDGSHAGSAARRRCRLFSRWSPRRRPPNRTCDFHRIRLSMSTSSGCPLAQLALSVKYPLPCQATARRCSPATSFHPACCVLTGPLRPVDGFPALPGAALLARLLRVLRHVPAATADGAPAPNAPTRVVVGHRRDASHVHS
jgi:hypothetical protein